MKIHPDKTRSYVRCKHCPDLQLTPNHILECPTVATKLLKMGMVPLRDSLRELLYSPDAPRIAEAVGLAIHQNDHQASRRFVEWAQNEIAVVPDFHKRILFSDGAHFWLNGYVNKQNCRIWSEANPQVYVETPLHLEKLTVWCALWAGGIIGPYFFKNDEGQIGLHPSQPWQSYARNHI
ncbi:uncharacterized protein TNCV_620941 [Trichonephila clavipes]|nr:uncharacterized protein TNCV_620941 [Trichonephila clavipes]